MPPIPNIVHASVFDAFGWCASDTLTWVSADGLGDPAPPGPENPPGLGFVLRPPEVDFLPAELAALHLPRAPLPEGARMLAPWAIDDATDLLYATRTPPGDALFLATTSLAALFWGLHDWAHFHAHGPFEERAATELQCDATALVWLRLNADVTRLSEAAWERARIAALALSRGRFAAEGLSFDPEALSAEALIALAARAVAGARCATSPGAAP